MVGNSCGEGKRSESVFFFLLGSRARKRVGGGLHEETRMGLGRWGSDVLRGDVTYLLCATSLHDADGMADERRRCQFIVEMMSKSGMKEREGEKRGMYRCHAYGSPCQR